MSVYFLYKDVSKKMTIVVISDQAGSIKVIFIFFFILEHLKHVLQIFLLKQKYQTLNE